MSTAFNSSSTSSSLIFSPRFVKTVRSSQLFVPLILVEIYVDPLYLSCPTPINPVISLSNTWKPLQYSSGSPGSRKPPGRLRILEKVSKSTGRVRKQYVSFRTPRPGCLIEVPCSQSLPTPFSRSLISASVGFCPHALRRSPSDSRATRPLPRLSNRANASL